MTDLKQLTIKKLKQFMPEHRRDDEKFSAALSELLSRDPDGVVYPANMPMAEVQRILQEKLTEVKRSQQ